MTDRTPGIEIKVAEVDDALILIDKDGYWRLDGAAAGYRNGIADMEAASHYDLGDITNAIYHARVLDSASRVDATIARAEVVATLDEEGLLTMTPLKMGEAARLYFNLPV